jgi:hypothetical protein
MPCGKAVCVNISHKKLINRLCIENHHRPEKPCGKKHKEKPSKAGDRLRRFFRVKIGIHRTQADS